jgi:hypothetical protein
MEGNASYHDPAVPMMQWLDVNIESTQAAENLTQDNLMTVFRGGGALPVTA